MLKKIGSVGFFLLSLLSFYTMSIGNTEAKSSQI